MAKPKLAPAPAPAPAPAAANESTPGPAKKSRKLLWIILVVLLLAGAGGGAWYYFHSHSAPDAKHEAAAEKKPTPTFVTLEPFTVNLLEEGGDHYLQVGIVFQVSDGKVVDTIKTYMPILRNRILLSLSSKHPSEIATLEGKQKLVAELVSAARESIPGEAPERGIDSAFLSAFVIQ
jgi:flagellar FliL protein